MKNASAIITFKQMKNLRGVGASYKHNYRKKDEFIHTDGTQTYLNQELIERDETMTIAGEIMQRASLEGIRFPKRKDSTCVIEILLTFSPQAVVEDVVGWAEDSVAYLKKEFGERNVISATLHRDESTPHIHAIIFPVIDGKVDAPKLLKSDKESYRIYQGYRYFQDTYATAMEKYGLSRGVKSSTAKHEDIHKMYGVLTELHDIKVPDYIEGEKIADYAERVNESIFTSIAPMVAEVTSLRSQLAQAKGEIKELSEKQISEKDRNWLFNMRAIMYAINNNLLGDETEDFFATIKEVASAGAKAMYENGERGK